MKIETDILDKSFKPVEVKFICETQDELDRFGALLNHTGFSRFIKDNSLKGVETVQNLGADISKYHSALLDHMITK